MAGDLVCTDNGSNPGYGVTQVGCTVKNGGLIDYKTGGDDSKKRDDEVKCRLMGKVPLLGCSYPVGLRTKLGAV